MGECIMHPSETSRGCRSPAFPSTKPVDTRRSTPVCLHVAQETVYSALSYTISENNIHLSRGVSSLSSVSAANTNHARCT